MQSALIKIIKMQKIIIFSVAVLFSLTVYSQNQDSLLEKIKDIEISLNEPPDSEENLYLNTVSFQSFYDVLSPMGEWIQITKEDIDEDLNDGEGQSVKSLVGFAEDDFLYIWKPNTDNSWKPYMNGRWEFTEQGWLWVSSDNWGNTTYNYGRWWNSLKYGWVWLPGYTWAPAWVRWKVSDNGKHLGWTALTPKAKWKSETGISSDNYKYKNNDADWVFTDYNSFTGELNSAKITTVNENSALVKNATDITDIRTENDVIITNGPDVNKIEEKTGKKYNRKRLRFQKGKQNTVIGENEVTLSKETFDRSNGEKLKKGKPNKFKKSERVKKIIRKKKIRNVPPPKRNK